MVYGDHGAHTLPALKLATGGLKQGQESVTILRQWMVVRIVPANHDTLLLATQILVLVSNACMMHYPYQYRGHDNKA